MLQPLDNCTMVHALSTMILAHPKQIFLLDIRPPVATFFMWIELGYRTDRFSDYKHETGKSRNKRPIINSDTEISAQEAKHTKRITYGEKKTINGVFRTTVFIRLFTREKPCSLRYTLFIKRYRHWSFSKKNIEHSLWRNVYRILGIWLAISNIRLGSMTDLANGCFLCPVFLCTKLQP